jgi:hypothetical protein
VRDVQLFITDDRYTVPTLHIIQIEGIAAVGEMAERLLASNVHYLAVEVFDGGVCVCAVGEARDRGSATEKR